MISRGLRARHRELVQHREGYRERATAAIAPQISRISHGLQAVGPTEVLWLNTQPHNYLGNLQGLEGTLTGKSSNNNSSKQNEHNHHEFTHQSGPKLVSAKVHQSIYWSPRLPSNSGKKMSPAFNCKITNQ